MDFIYRICSRHCRLYFFYCYPDNPIKMGQATWAAIKKCIYMFISDGTKLDPVHMQIFAVLSFAALVVLVTAVWERRWVVERRKRNAQQERVDWAASGIWKKIKTSGFLMFNDQGWESFQRKD